MDKTTPELDDNEIARRRDEALRRALSTPPKPKSGTKKKVKPASPADEAKPRRRERSVSGS